jgi:hypothetical protein
MDKMSPEIRIFARTCERLLFESSPREITEEERLLIEHYSLELFSRYAKREEKKRSRWTSVIQGL